MHLPFRIAGVVEGSREGPGESDLFVELTDGQQSGVAGELAWRWLKDKRRAKAVQDLRPGGWYTQRRSSRLQK